VTPLTPNSLLLIEGSFGAAGVEELHDYLGPWLKPMNIALLILERRDVAAPSTRVAALSEELMRELGYVRKELLDAAHQQLQEILDGA